MSYRLKRFVRRHTMFSGLPERGKGYVFIFGGYVPNGGTYMAYSIGRIIQQVFGRTPVVVDVDLESPGESPFEYPEIYPIISISEMIENAGSEDIIVVNPSFSEHFIGKRSRGIKICYVQHFTGYRILDCFHDLYVSVSPFVAEYIDWVYRIKSSVIPAYIHVPPVGDIIPWSDRPADSVFVYHKTGAPAQDTLLDEFLRQMRDLRPDLDPATSAKHRIPYDELQRMLRRHRYFVALSPTEGFGLVPLEAMAAGATVVGLDGFGGREYMRPSENCLASSYPDVDAVPGFLAQVLEDIDLARTLAENGRRTALGYGFDVFRQRWTAAISTLLGETPRTVTPDDGTGSC